MEDLKWYEIYNKVSEYVNSSKILKDIANPELITTIIIDRQQLISCDSLTLNEMIIGYTPIIIKHNNTISYELIRALYEDYEYRYNIDNKLCSLNHSYVFIQNKISKSLVQISFANNANLSEVKTQLTELKSQLESDNEYVRFVHCFLPRNIVMQKGFSTDIVDLLDEVLGDSQICLNSKYDDFDKCIKDMPINRDIAAKITYTTYILGESTINNGIKEEIRLASKDKVIIL